MALFYFICRSSEMYFFVIKFFHEKEEPFRFALYPRSGFCSPAGKHRFESFRRNFYNSGPPLYSIHRPEHCCTSECYLKSTFGKFERFSKKREKNNQVNGFKSPTCAYLFRFYTQTRCRGYLSTHEFCREEFGKQI